MYTKECTIWCDAENCLQWVRYGYSTAAATRKRAADDGWAYKGGEDYCPDHIDAATTSTDH